MSWMKKLIELKSLAAPRRNQKLKLLKKLTWSGNGINNLFIWLKAGGGAALLMNDGWVGLLERWRVMGAAAPMAPPKGSEHQQTPPTTAEWMKWNNSTWMAVNQFIWLMEWIELVSLNGGALRPRSSAANQSINSLLKKEEKWKLIWIDCGASCLFFSLSLAGPLAPLARSFILFENEAAMVDYGLSEPSQQARRELVCLSLIREGWKWSEGELMDWSGAGNI